MSEPVYTVLQYEPYENYEVVLADATADEVTAFMQKSDGYPKLRYADDLTIIEGRQLSEADVQKWFNEARAEA